MPRTPVHPAARNRLLLFVSVYCGERFVRKAYSVFAGRRRCHQTNRIALVPLLAVVSLTTKRTSLPPAALLRASFGLIRGTVVIRADFNRMLRGRNNAVGNAAAGQKCAVVHDGLFFPERAARR